MSKTRKSRRARKSTVRPEVDVVSQLETAVRHPAAAALGGAIGGVVPWFARTLAHGEVPAAWHAGQWSSLAIELVVVAGCVLFSVLTVYKFGLAAFGSPRKAAGFVAAMEGVMLVSHGSTSLAALAVLIAINCIANGCIIALARDATMRRREADGRRSATRAGNRAATRASAAAPVVQVEVPTATPARDRRASAPVVALVPRGRDSFVDAEFVDVN